MRVWVEPPKGPRGGRSEIKAYAREVTTGAHIDELAELERRGFTFRTDDLGKCWPSQIASYLKLGSTPREAELDRMRDAIVASLDDALGLLHDDEREHWFSTLLERLNARRAP